MAKLQQVGNQMDPSIDQPDWLIKIKLDLLHTLIHKNLDFPYTVHIIISDVAHPEKETNHMLNLV